MNPKISVLLSTYNRADYLKLTLESIAHQTLPVDDYEVILINDGSTDNTSDVVEAFMQRLPIRYFYHDNQGLAASKNRGIYEAFSPLILFQDDDDIAAPDLFEEHLKAHRDYAAENYAVLGYTDISDSISTSPLMDYVTNVGCFLFSYPSLHDGDILNYTSFWGGRSSCKKSFLDKYGVFDPAFKFGCEDIELGYRLSKHGLKVVFRKRAKSTMMRLMTIDDFFNRLIKQGESQYQFSLLHNKPEILHWAEVVDADDVWEDVEPVFEALLDSARHLDAIVNTRYEEQLEVDDYTIQLLHRSYWNAFKACKLKGIRNSR